MFTYEIVMLPLLLDITIWLQVSVSADEVPVVGFSIMDVDKNNGTITFLMNDTVRWQDGAVIETVHCSCTPCSR